MGIRFGSLSIEHIEKRLGITLSNEERIAMKEIHSNAADMPFGTWHCFDAPFTLVCNGSDAANIVLGILRPYSGKMMCPLRIEVK